VLDSGITNLLTCTSRRPRTTPWRRRAAARPDALGGLPLDVLAKLRKAVIAARYNEIIKIIETVRTTEPSLATELLRMADLFDYDRIRHFLNSGKDDENGR